ncbi:MAG: hypothetical protein QNI99_02435 [Woeseiaceae bacterium]|nr:hypothetical protein [Woeseiaceae bacterium]
MSKAYRDVNHDPSKTWKTEYDEDAHVVVSTIWGRMSDQELMAAAADRIRLGNEKDTSEFILDVSGFKANDRSTFESVFEIVTRSYPEMNKTSEARIAFIPTLDEDSQWFVDFFKNMCDSRGWVLHEVPDHEAAYAWLKNPPDDTAD